MKTIPNKISILIIVFSFSGCLSSKQPYYFSWLSIQDNGFNDSGLAANSNSIRSTPKMVDDWLADTLGLVASISKVPVNTSYQEVTLSNLSNTVINSPEETPKEETHIQNLDVRSEKEDVDKGKFAKIGFGLTIAGFIALLGVPLFLSSYPLLVAFPLLLAGFILCMIGIKSQKRKLAIAGMVVSGLFLVLALIGIGTIFAR